MFGFESKHDHTPSFLSFYHPLVQPSLLSDLLLCYVVSQPSGSIVRYQTMAEPAPVAALRAVTTAIDTVVTAITTATTATSPTVAAAGIVYFRDDLKESTNDKGERVVNDVWVIGKKLGAGAFASVRLATHITNGHVAAMKRMSKQKLRQVSIINSCCAFISVCIDEYNNIMIDAQHG